jgi:hypothetical protein
LCIKEHVFRPFWSAKKCKPIFEKICLSSLNKQLGPFPLPDSGPAQPRCFFCSRQFVAHGAKPGETMRPVSRLRQAAEATKGREGGKCNGVAVPPARCGLRRLSVCAWKQSFLCTDPPGAADGSPHGRVRSPGKHFRRHSGLSVRSPLPPCHLPLLMRIRPQRRSLTDSLCEGARVICSESSTISGLRKFVYRCRSVLSSQ